MKKILYLLLTTEKYKNRQENILSSWGKEVDLFFYSEHSDIERKVIKVCNENNVEIKQISIFKKIEESFFNQYEWFFFGDDDTFVNTKLMEKEIDTFEKDKVHGYVIYAYSGSLSYPSGGGGFLISNDLIRYFFDSKNYDVGYGDMTFGLNAREKNIAIKSNDKFNGQHPSFYNISIKDCYKYLTFHYLKKKEELIDMDIICKKNK
jgi:hypothetical protein